MVLKIQDKEYLLKYDVNALVMLEEITGKSLGIVLNEELGFKVLRDLLYVGLVKHQKDMTFEKTGDIMQEFLDQGQDIKELAEILLKTFEKANLVKRTEEDKKK